MLYLTCTTITSVDLAHYGVSRAKDLVSGLWYKVPKFRLSGLQAFLMFLQTKQMSSVEHLLRIQSIGIEIRNRSVFDVSWIFFSCM